MFALVVALGCQGPDASPDAAKAVPSDRPAKLVAIPQPEVKRADGRRNLRVTTLQDVPVDGLADLSEDQRFVAMAVLNTSSSPCAPCLDDGVSLAACVTAPPADCPTVGAVAQRVVRLVADGADLNQAKAAVEYGDGWYPLAQPVDGVDFAVWLDGGSLDAQSQERFDALVAACPQLVRRDLESRPESARSAPTVYINGYRLRGLQSLDSYRRLVDQELMDQGASCPG